MLAAGQVREAAAGGDAASHGEGDEAADEEDAEGERAEGVEQPEDHGLLNDQLPLKARPSAPNVAPWPGQRTAGGFGSPPRALPAPAREESVAFVADLAAEAVTPTAVFVSCTA